MQAQWEKYFEANKQLWNKRTQVHLDSKFYNVEGFIAGNTVLNPIELSLLGDVAHKSLLHLQCHFGLDSLDWARRGAKVTGVDISNDAIAKAQQINAAIGTDAQFICSNIYDLNTSNAPQYDIVFTTYGTIGWLPDLDQWAAVIAASLKPGGQFLIIDFHPALWMYSDDFSELAYSYFNREVITTVDAPTYTEGNQIIDGAEYGWNHSFGEILGALLKHGLRITHFQEYDYSPYPCFANTVEVTPGQWQIEGMEGNLPMLYSIMCIK